MHKTITKSLSFFLALALMLSVFPMAVLAAGHVHNYEVTTVKPDTYEGYDNNQHYIVERHKHLVVMYFMNIIEKSLSLIQRLLEAVQIWEPYWEKTERQ